MTAQKPANPSSPLISTGETVGASKEASAKARSNTADNDSANSAKEGGGAFPIVGVGMSAGGLEAVSRFLEAMPPDTGMGFVMVQHLDPTHESKLAELLSRQTAMPVIQIKDGLRIEPNCVYVIIPDRYLLIRDRTLYLVKPTEPRGHTRPIDVFFRALAEEQRERAICIILSGAGSNGTAGLREVKSVGGMCIAQDPETAKFDSMPRHAIASGLVDYILAPEKMPDALLRYAANSYMAGEPKSETLAPQAGSDLHDLLVFLRARANRDFQQYQKSSLLRRTHRRMSLSNVERLADYMAILRGNPNEVTALVKDLLINVTGFFRDAEAWQTLDEKVVAPLVNNAESGQTIRVWVPACASGEEAYTMAILLVERAEAADKRLGIKIFATDTAEHSLNAARMGVFPGSVVASLSPERLARFFDRKDDTYQIKKEIRELVMFASQDLLQDPPFSNMDLVSCRNLLIYLQPEAQQRVLALAHFALREGGHLILGNAETIGQREHLFATVSKRWRIYRRIGTTRTGLANFPAFRTRSEQVAQLETPPAPKLADIALEAMADQYAPAAVLIDRTYRIVHFHGRTNDYLAQPPGTPTTDLLTLAREGLPLTVRHAVHKAIEDAQTVIVSGQVKRNTETYPVVVTATPLPSQATADGLTLVCFAERADAPHLSISLGANDRIDQPTERDLEEALGAVQDELMRMTEQMESSNEELKAANEEVTSINEELQSTNEELEASKEELQSLNEELHTVNTQLERKVRELQETTDDLKNLLASTHIATICLDTKFHIKWFTPAVEKLIDLVASDIGRPISHFTQKFSNCDLSAKARAVTEQLISIEEEVRTDSNRWYLLRVLPYRAGGDRIDGTVATFTDITERKEIEAKIREARDFAEAVIKTIRNPLLVLNSDLRVQSANQAYYNLFRVTEHETLLKLVYELGGGQWNVPQLRTLLEHVLPEKQHIDGYVVEHDFPNLGQRTMVLNARRLAGDGERPDLILVAIEDATLEKDWEQHQQTLISELGHRIKNTLNVIQSLATETGRGSTTIETFLDSFQGRLQALALAHDAVIEKDWNGVQLRTLVDHALKSLRLQTGVARMHGPSIELLPEASVTITMILHELATNAIKYGALSKPDGRVEIDWQLEAGEAGQRVRLNWTEREGPRVERPSRRGYGIRFIERSVSDELHGMASIEFRQDGLRAAISFPLTVTSPPREPVPTGLHPVVVPIANEIPVASDRESGDTAVR